MIEIGGRQFKVSKISRAALAGRAVRAYCLPRSMTLLSIEPLDGPRGDAGRLSVEG